MGGGLEMSEQRLPGGNDFCGGDSSGEGFARGGAGHELIEEMWAGLGMVPKGLAAELSGDGFQQMKAGGHGRKEGGIINRKADTLHEDGIRSAAQIGMEADAGKAAAI